VTAVEIEEEGGAAPDGGFGIRPTV